MSYSEYTEEHDLLDLASQCADQEIAARIEWAAELASYGYSEEEIAETMGLLVDDNYCPGDEFNGLAW